MKKVVYRDILGNNPRKREVSIEEINERLSDKVAKKWICKYFIKEMYTSSSAKELKHWIRTQQKSGVKKDSHILRKVDARTGENKIIYKVLGDIFVISGHTAYKIVYVNELKIETQIPESLTRGVR